MTLVKKDLSDAVRIDAIPMKSLDTIKEWLASIDIKFYESKINLQWPAILKSIRENPEAFVEDGGWDFLDAEADDGDEESDEGDEEFAPSEGEKGGREGGVAFFFDQSDFFFNHPHPPPLFLLSRFRL